MAKQSETQKLERSYTIPLRREFLKVQKYKRAKKAVTAVQEFLKKHMKSDDVKIGPELNKFIWKKGVRNPPHKVKIHAVKEENTVTAEIEGVEYKSLQIKSKTETAKGLKGKLQGLMKSEKKEGIEDLAEQKKSSKKEKKAEASKTQSDKKESKEETKTDESSEN